MAFALGAALDVLEEKKLVTVRHVGPFRVASLTEAGADVAAGRVTVEGVLSPSLHQPDA